MPSLRLDVVQNGSVTSSDIPNLNCHKLPTAASFNRNMNKLVLLCISICILGSSSVFAQGNSTKYPPGWNGEAKTPPMGWRSWNAFGKKYPILYRHE